MSAAQRLRLNPPSLPAGRYGPPTGTTGTTGTRVAPLPCGRRGDGQRPYLVARRRPYPRNGGL